MGTLSRARRPCLRYTHSFVISVAWEFNPRFYTSNPQRNCRRLGSSVSGRNDHHLLRKPRTSHVLTPQWQQCGKQETGALCFCFPISVCLGGCYFEPFRCGFQPSFLLVTVCEPEKSRNFSKLPSFPGSLSILFCPGLSSGACGIAFGPLSHSEHPRRAGEMAQQVKR